MKELVVISGKGGTGKTSIVASFATLAKNAVVADCDVDAADLHLILQPTIETQGSFSGGSRATIKTENCSACGKCKDVCRFDAVYFDGPDNGKVDKTYHIDPISCEGCGVCNWFCPSNTIDFRPINNGRWFISNTRCGPMVHAKLGVAEENSGKLVSLVREKAKSIAKQRTLERLIIDGSPGIGCSVIASITATNLALVVTEPTLSGLHDLQRVADLTKHFGIKTLVCINKWDLNKNVTVQIEKWASMRGIKVSGKIRYDHAATKAQIQKLSIVEYQDYGIAQDIKKLWAEVDMQLDNT